MSSTAARRAAAGAMLLLGSTLAGPLAAQGASAAACSLSGIVVTTDSATAGPLADGETAREAIDTTHAIAVERRTWSARDLSAGVAAGIGGMDGARWSACAGASVNARRADLQVQGAYGTVHIRADLRPLLQRLRLDRPRPDHPRREQR